MMVGIMSLAVAMVMARRTMIGWLWWCDDDIMYDDGDADVDGDGDDGGCVDGDYNSDEVWWQRW